MTDPLMHGALGFLKFKSASLTTLLRLLYILLMILNITNFNFQLHFRLKTTSYYKFHIELSLIQYLSLEIRNKFPLKVIFCLRLKIPKRQYGFLTQLRIWWMPFLTRCMVLCTYCYFCITKTQLQIIIQFTIPLAKMLGFMKRTNFLERIRMY